MKKAIELSKLEELVAHMKEKVPDENGKVILSTNCLGIVFGKQHGINKKNIVKFGKEYGLSWLDKYETSQGIQYELHNRDMNNDNMDSNTDGRIQRPKLMRLADTTSSYNEEQNQSFKSSKRWNSKENDVNVQNYLLELTNNDDNRDDNDSNSVLFTLDELKQSPDDYSSCGLIGISGDNKSVYINTKQPFCVVCVGVQGSGKSHTMNVVLENCLIDTPIPEAQPVSKLHHEMCGLVFHYDQSETNVCEASGLANMSTELVQLLGVDSGVNKVVILVSPSFYSQRKHFYSNNDKYEIKPLLFKWSNLDAAQLKKLMRLSDSDAQLYVSVMLGKIREYQKSDKLPTYEKFRQEMNEACKSTNQSGPLEQRLALLDQVLVESQKNIKYSTIECTSLSELMEEGTLVIADLTDPMLSAPEANGIFQVLLQQFRQHRLPQGVGKVVAFDEAHKYLTATNDDDLSNAIVNTVRLMRHEDIRVLISTQSPKALPSELLELVTVAVLHNFQSKEWYSHLSTKIPAPIDGFNTVNHLKPGKALIISNKLSKQLEENGENDEKNDHLLVKIRRRFTCDFGATQCYTV